MTESPEDDPFERVRREASKGDAGRAAKPAAGDLVAPAPADAPPLPNEWRELGSPSRSWAFLDAAGRVLRYTLRFPEADAAKGEAERPRSEWTGKTIRAATLRRGDNGRLRWALKAEADHRPLYGLDRLAARPGAPVLMVEGEKDADGAADRFPAFACVTWPGGSNAVGKADFAPLEGRTVIVWGDADAPGRKASQAAAKAAASAGAVTVAVVEPPGYFPEGWGLADPWPEGFGQEKAAALIEASRSAAHPAGVDWPWGFRMDGDGLWYDQPGQGGGKPIPTRIAAPFEVVGEARDPDGGGWAVVIGFRDRDGREKTVPIPKGRLAGGGAEVRAELADAGLMISPARGKADKFAIALTEVTAVRRLTLVSATGWCGERFVLPGKTVGPGAEPILFTGKAKSLSYRTHGARDGWRAGVAALAEGNDLLTFALSAGFVGALLRPLGWEGGGVHLRGGSSCGKSTLQEAAGSIWGGGGAKGFVQDWRTTDNALEVLAYGHNDGVLILDELKNIEASKAGVAAYMLASGQAKARAQSDGGMRERAEWRVFVISSGELSLADHVSSDRKGERSFAGQEIRLLDLAADMGVKNPDGSSMGVWQDLHAHGTSFEASKALSDAAKRDYGHAGPAFLEAFSARRAEALPQAKVLLAAFLANVSREGDTGQAQRAAERFGAVAVAGELATLFGVLPWPAGTASSAAQRLYHRWAAGFGRDRSREAGEVFRLARRAIETPGGWGALGDEEVSVDGSPASTSREGEARSLTPFGWRRVRGPEVTYLFTRGGWAQAFPGHNGTEAARVLADAGFLERSADDHRLQKKVKVRGEGHWLYCVRGTLLEASDLGD